ncbi:MAG: amidohydrolase family protein [Candidatus Poribacteria bacterium]|nr:amidohydrolase family protein [Candidatus Poribacteria bacterium]
MRGDFEAYLNDSFRDENGKLNLASLLALEDEADMDVAVIMPNTQPLPQNAELGEAIRGNSRALGCALVHPTEPDPVEQVKLAAEEWGMRGIKLMPAVHNYNVDDPIVRPVVEAARDHGLIVSIHSGPNNCHPNRIGTVAGWVPETPVIMDHMGFPDDLDAAISVAKANKNISLGTTILRFHRRWGTDPDAVVPTEVKKAVDELGPEQIVFGSNLPEYRPIQVINALKRLELGDDAEALIFGENLARIYEL